MINPYFEKFKVRAAEIGPNSEAKFPVLINFFQEAAWQHADALGVSVPVLMEHGHTWVLHRLYLKVLQPVEKNEVVEVETWPSGIEKFFTYRDMRFRNEKQELVAEGCTAWLVIDLEKRRLIPVPDYITSGNYVIENHHLPHPVDKLPSLEDPTTGPEFKVYFQHLDQNRHVNNVHYLEWMLASLPQDYLLNMRVKEIDIQFKSECVLNDEIVSEFQQLSAGEVLHCLKEKYSNREVARALSCWKER
jgi:medium-chain acyl-[acyl-carrier-protein] hydrolase